MNSREKYILQVLQQRGSVSLSELSNTLGVSLVTIRKDVSDLESQDLVSRQHGKVSLPFQYESSQIPFGLRAVVNEQDKRMIAKAAARLVQPGDAIALDSGTTTAIAARIDNILQKIWLALQHRKPPLPAFYNRPLVVSLNANLPKVIIIDIFGMFIHFRCCTGHLPIEGHPDRQTAFLSVRDCLIQIQKILCGFQRKRF